MPLAACVLIILLAPPTLPMPLSIAPSGPGGMLARADAVWGPLFGLAGCARAGQRAVARGKGKLRVALGATDWRLAVPRTDSH